MCVGIHLSIIRKLRGLPLKKKSICPGMIAVGLYAREVNGLMDKDLVETMEKIQRDL